MERKTALKIAEVQEQAAKHPEYLELWEEYQGVCPKLLDLLEKLSPKDAAIVEDYLGLTAEMHRFLLELACE